MNILVAIISEEIRQKIRDNYPFEQDAAIFGYTLAQKELEAVEATAMLLKYEKQIFDLKKEIELLKSVLNMHQKIGRI